MSASCRMMIFLVTSLMHAASVAASEQDPPMRHITTGAAIAAQPATKPAATQPAASQSAQAHKMQTIEHDFGQVWEGDPVTHTFEVMNTSDHVLVLYRD